VTRDGAVEFDAADTDNSEIQAVVEALKAAGFESENGADVPQECGDGEQGENVAKSAEDSGTFTMSYPSAGFTPETLENLRKMVNSKAPLLKKALEVDELPIEVDGEEVKFTWFKAPLGHAEITSYSRFLCQLCKTAQSKKRVTATAPEAFPNEKFSMRTWLISLDMKGEDFALARKMLMEKLDGSAANRYDTPLNPRGGERVEKQVLSVRFTADMLAKIEAAATNSGMSRNAFIERVVSEYVVSETGAVETAPETEVEDGDE
jgi:predicted HicB family RNase H-like nuclease